MENAADRVARQLASALTASRRRIVFAESCTAGLAASLMADIPGVSECFCGSAVVYRNATKQAWLGIRPDWLADPDIGPVSREVADAMAVGALESTPEADVSAAVTGHLGPDAPPALDGVVCLAVAVRNRAGGEGPAVVASRRIQLQSRDDDRLKLRALRRGEATRLLLEAALHVVQAD